MVTKVQTSSFVRKNYRTSTGALQLTNTGSCNWNSITYSNSPGFPRNLKWNNCLHRNFPPFTGVISRLPQYSPAEYWDIRGWSNPAIADSYAGQLRTAFLSKLSSPKLDFKQNNKFRLWVLLGQLDDLIATFTIKCAKTLLHPMSAYGGWSWNIFPLISDINSLISSYYDIMYNIQNELELLKNIPITKLVRVHVKESASPIPGLPPMNGTASANIGFYGTITMQPLPENAFILAALDEFGVMLRVSDLVEFIPLSFMLNAWFPTLIKMLDSMAPSLDFLEPKFHYEGWGSIKIECQYSHSSEYNPYAFGTYYERFAKSGKLLPVPVQFEFTYPTKVKYLYDAFYLMVSRLVKVR